MKKIHRHEKWVTMKPPSGGPNTGPSIAGVVTMIIARKRSALGTARSITKRPTGDIIAPPRPCSMRAAMNCQSVSDNPQAIEPIMNTPIAARKTVRAPKRSAIHPLNGMKMERLKR
jgi:hypothetical protein